MKARVKDNSLRSRYIVIGSRVIFVLVAVWYLLLGMKLFIDTSIIAQNSELVTMSSEKERILSISPEEVITLESGEEVAGSDTSDYILVKEGTGIWYVPDGMMTVELTGLRAWGFCLKFLVVDWATYIIILLLLVRNLNSKWKSISILVLEVLRELFSFVVLPCYADLILGDLWEGVFIWICVLRFVICACGYWFYRRKFRKG